MSKRKKSSSPLSVWTDEQADALRREPDASRAMLRVLIWMVVLLIAVLIGGPAVWG